MQSAIQRVLSAFPPPGPEGFDLKAFIEDDEQWTGGGGVFAPDVVTRFITPDGGFVGPLAGPFRGPEGFRTGWREWLRAWDSYVARIDEALESEDGGRVLLVVTSRATMAGSGTVIDQPSAALYRLRDRQIVQVDHYLDHDQARREFEG